MGKRKAAAKPPTRKRMDKLDMVFSCPFCNHGSSVERRMRLRRVGWTAAAAELLHGLLQFQGERASKERRRYRRTEGRERRKGRGVAALTVNLRLRRSPARGGARRRREPTGRRLRGLELRDLGRLDAFGSQAKGYVYWKKRRNQLRTMPGGWCKLLSYGHMVVIPEKIVCFGRRTKGKGSICVKTKPVVRITGVI